MCGTFKTRSLKCQLLTILTGLGVVFLTIITLECVAFLYITTNKISNKINDDLIDQFATSIKTVLQQQANLFDLNMQNSVSSGINLVSYGTEECFRSDFPYGFVPSYLDYPSTLAADGSLAFDPRYNTNVTYEHSSYNVYQINPQNLYTLSASTNQTISNTATLDPLFKTIYQNEGTFLSLYIAFAQQGLFREYPGATSSNVQSLFNYDPRTEDWNQQAMNNPTDTTFTSPYYDNYVKQLMITVTRVFRHVVTGTVLGASGVDMAISQVRSQLQAIKYQGTGRVILFEASSGLVIADTAINIVTDPPNYSALTNPIIADDLWTPMTSQNSTFQIVNDYMIASVKPLAGGGQYLLIIEVPLNVIQNNVNTIIASLNDIRNTTGAGLGIASAVILVVIAAFVMYRVNSIVSPLQKISKASTQIMQNLGSDDLYKGLDDVKQIEGAPPGVELKQMDDEPRRLQAEFGQMIRELDANRQRQAGAAFAENNLFGNFQSNQSMAVNAAGAVTGAVTGSAASGGSIALAMNPAYPSAPVNPNQVYFQVPFDPYSMPIPTAPPAYNADEKG